ncbi:MAG: hypothetical protein H6807_04485 [Planctomycetes bacterium]|nr:hypothetical protein [Planctomycetota bacterium]
MSRRQHHPTEQGSVLVIALGSFALAVVFFMLMFGSVNAEATRIEVDLDRSQALRHAEGMIEQAEFAILDATASYRPVEHPDPADSHVVLIGNDLDGDLDGSWRVRRATLLDGNGLEQPVPASNTTDPETGLKSVLEPYVLSAEARFRSARVRVSKRILVKKTPIFQFLAFYDHDLEINPGPNMVLNGRIHANADLYLTAGNGLTVDSHYCRAVGEVFRRRKDSSSLPSGWVQVRNRDDDRLVTLPDRDDLAAAGIPSRSGLDSDFKGWDLDGDGAYDQSGEMAPFAPEVSALFAGTLMSGEHGVKTMAHPDIGSIQAYEAMPGGSGGDYVRNAQGGYDPVAPGTGSHAKGYFHASAGLVVLDDRVFDGNGNEVTALMPAGFLAEKSFYDAREGRTVTVTVLDLGRLGDMDGDRNTYDPSPYYPDNGLLFAERSDAQAGSPNGVVLTNGAELNVPSRWDLAQYGSGGAFAGLTPPVGARAFGVEDRIGLTVVSPAPVFVHGDFNTEAKKPSAVLTDTVSLLSNAWDFSKSSSSSLPAASSTRYNLAFITGNQITSSGHYNGGFENLPRFHESWSGKTCRIRGSFVNIWRSAVATGAWYYGGKNYTAPDRDWGFDDGFDTELPPFTPMAVDTVNVGIEIRG